MTRTSSTVVLLIGLMIAVPALGAFGHVTTTGVWLIQAGLILTCIASVNEIEP